MEPFVTRIGDVTIERVVPRAGKDPKDNIPVPSVSLAKRGIAGGEDENINDGINVSEDLQIFLKPPIGDLKECSGRKSLDQSGKGVGENSSDIKKVSRKVSTDDERSDEDSDIEDEGGREMQDKCDSESDNSRIVTQDQRTESGEPMESCAENPPGIPEVAGDAVGCRENENDAKENGDTTKEKIETNKRKASSETCAGSNSTMKKKKAKILDKDGKEISDKVDKSSSSSESDDNTEDHSKHAMERKVSNLRRNIREVMNESQLDEETLAAQRQEMERLRRVQEQQRIIREVQRQIALNRQNTKTQTRVISLLQGGNSSILKQIPGTSGSSGTQVRLPNTVLVKLASSSNSNTAAPSNKKVFELLRVQKGATGRGTSPVNRPGGTVRTVLGKSRTPGQVHMMTPSVSIAPVMSSTRNLEPGSESESETEEGSDKDAMARAALRKVAGKPKGKDVVTISSSSDDDDCILLSEPSSGDEAEPVDDPTNSGMHTNDLYNVPDDQCRVLVNVGHPPEDADIFLAPQIARVIKPHQIGGVRFLYDNVVESMERFTTSTGFGCILAHSMGLGKTLQVVSFCDVFLRHTKARTVLCIMPINTLQNWLAEFNMWLPDKNPQNCPLAVHGEVRPRNFPLHVLNDSHKSMTARSKVIQEWDRDGGVLLIGYELYRQLSLKRSHKSKKKRKKSSDVVDIDEEDRNKALLDEIHSALVKPGPDLVICDEGHRIKNSHASISQALKQIRSKRRVVLTGYPLQNNLLEYWCMVDFVRPNYLGTKTEFCNMFERPIQNGQCIDSTPQDIRLMRYRAHVLHSLLEGFVQRRSHSVLQVSLPQKEEYVLLLRMNSFQRKLYDTFMNEVVRTKAVPNPLKAFAVCCKIWNHPDVLYYFLKKRAGDEDVDLDLEEATASTTVPAAGNASARGVATKRGRGRGARSGQANKREKKASTSSTPLQMGNPGNKPAATIVPNNTNINTDSSGMPLPPTSLGVHTSHGQVSGIGGTSGQMHTQIQHQQSQGFNIIGHQTQNQTYNGGPNAYHNLPYHQNATAQNSGQGYNSQGSYGGSGYPHNSNNSSYTSIDVHGYGGSSHTASYSECSDPNTQTSQQYSGGPGHVYYSSNSGPNQQGGYSSYYSSTSNQQDNNEGTYQCNSNSGTNYWQNNQTSFYQQNMHSQNNASAGNNENQYYGNNNSSGSYVSAEESSYYMNHHHQNSSQTYSGQMSGSMYHGMNPQDGFVDNMGHLHGSRNPQNQMGGSPNRIGGAQNMMSAQPSRLRNPPNHINSLQGQISNQTGNIQNQVNNSSNQIANPNQIGNSNQIGQSQNQMGNSQPHVTKPCQINNSNQMDNSNQIVNTSSMGNSQNSASKPCQLSNQNQLTNSNQVGNSNQITSNQSSSQNTIGSLQNQLVNSNQVGNSNQIGSSHNQMAGSQNSLGNHNQVGNSQNQMSSSSNQIGSSNNQLSTTNQIGGTQNMGTSNQMGNSHGQLNTSNQIGNSQSIGPPNQIGNSQNTSSQAGNSHNQLGTLNQIGNSHNQLGTLNQIGNSHNQLGTPNQMGNSPNQMSNNQIGNSQNVGAPNQIGNSQNQLVTSNQIGNTHSLLGTQNQISTPNQIGNTQNMGTSTQIGSSQNQMSATNQIGNTQAQSLNSLGSTQNQLENSNQLVNPNQMGTPPNQGVNPNQIGNSQNQMINPNQIGNSQNSMGSTQNQMTTTNQMGNSQNQVVNPNQIGSSQSQVVSPNQIGNSQNQMTGTNHMGNSPNQMMNSNQLGNTLNQMGNPNPIGNSQNQMGNPNQIGNSQNQMGNPNQIGNSQNQMGNPNQIGNSQNQMGNPNQIGNSQNQMGNPNQIGNTPNQMGNPNQIGNTQNQMGNPNQIGNTQNQMGNPNQIGNSQNQMGNSQNQMGNPNQIGNIQNQMTNTNQIGNSQSQMTNANQIGSSQNHMGNSQNQMINPNQTPNSQNQMTNTNQMGNSPNQMINSNQIPNSLSQMGNSGQIVNSLNQMGNPNQIGNSQNQMINSNQISNSLNQMGNPSQIGNKQNQIVSPSQLGSSQSQIGNPQNQLVNPNQLGNSQNQIENQMVTSNQLGNSQNQIGNPNQLGNPQNQMVNPNQLGNSQNQMINPNQLGNSQNQIVNPQNQMVNSNQIGNSQNQIGSPPNQIASPNQITNSQNTITSSHIGNPQNQMSSPNQIANSQNSIINPSQVSNQQNQMASSNQITNTQNSIMSPSQIGNTQNMGAPNQIGNSQNMMSNPNQIGNSQSQMSTPNQIGISHNQLGNHTVNSQNQLGNSNPIGNAQNQIGSPNQIGNSQNQLGTSNQIVNGQNKVGNSNLIGNSQNQLGNSSHNGNPQNMVGNSNQIGSTHSQIENSQNQMNNRNQIGTVNSLGNLQNQLNTTNQMGNSNQIGSPQNQMNAPNQISNLQNQIGNPNEMNNTPSQMGSIHLGSHSQLNNSQKAVGNNNNQIGNPNQMENLQGQSQIGNSRSQIGNLHDSLSSLGNMQASSVNICNPLSNSIASYSNQSQIISTTHSSNQMAVMQNTMSSSQTILNKLQMGSMAIPYPSQLDVDSRQGTGASSGQHPPYLNAYNTPSMQATSSTDECNEFTSMEQSYPSMGRVGDMKCEGDVLPMGCNSSLHGMGAMYNHFQSEGRVNQWGSSSKSPSNESNTLNNTDANDMDMRNAVKIESQKKTLTSELNQHFEHNAPSKEDCKDSSSLKIKSECDEKCGESSNSLPVGKIVSTGHPNCKTGSTDNETGVIDECQTSNDVKLEGSIQGTKYLETSQCVDSNSPVKTLNADGVSCKSDQCTGESKESEVLLDDVKCTKTEYSLNKSVSTGTDAVEEESKDVGCGTASDNYKSVADCKQFADLGTNTSRSFIKEDLGIPYDWATELLKNYVPGSIENSAKMEVFFCILEESMALGDRMLVFSQSLFTLNLIEDFLQRNNLPGRQEKWARNWNYYRLDGSTSALEREKLINEYNSNPNIHLFLVSTRAGSLGINLVGANRVVVFDASWNPCHDTQAVCRVYRYGQKKPCFVYRLVMDNCLEKKIYDRQINKQGMADRVVDECNPDAHLSIKEVTNLCWDNEEETEVRDFSKEKDKYIDVVMQKVLDKYSAVLSKEPFQHESLLVDRKEKKLSQAEKRLAKRSYELEKQANINYNRPQYTYYPTPGVGNSGVQTSLQIRAIRTDAVGGNTMPKPVASVRPMQAELSSQMERGPRSTVSTINTGRSRWIPADVWQRQGMSAQEMTLPLDVVIPTNSPDRASIVLKAGQRVMVLKSPKGIYMQLENGKIIAIRTAFKVGGAGKGAAAQDYKATAALNADKADMESKLADIKKEGNIPPINRNNTKISNVLPLKNNSAITIIPKNNPATNITRPTANMMNKYMTKAPPPVSVKHDSNMKPWGSNSGGLARARAMIGRSHHNQPTAEAKPYFHHHNQIGRPAESYGAGNMVGNQPTAMAKPYFHQDGESRRSQSTHSSISDDASSGAENMASSSVLLQDEKDSSSMGESEMMLKSPLPSPDYAATARRREEVDHDSGMPYEDMPHQEKDGHGFSRSHGIEEDSSFPPENSSFQSEAGSWQSSQEQNGEARSFQGISLHSDENKSLQISAMNGRNFQVFPNKNSNNSFQLSEFGRPGDVTGERRLDQVDSLVVHRQESSNETRSNQDIKMTTSFNVKGTSPLPVNTISGDKGSLKHFHHSFNHTQRQTMDNGTLKLDDSTRNMEEASTPTGDCALKSHTYNEQMMKSPGNFQGNLESTTNSYGSFERSTNSSQGNDNGTHQANSEQHKNLMGSYAENNGAPTSVEDFNGESKQKCDTKGESHYEFGSTRGSSEVDMNSIGNQAAPLNQPYLSGLTNQTQPNSQMSPSQLTPSKKGRSSKPPTSNSERVSVDYPGRYDSEHQHMKPYHSNGSSNSQPLDQTVPPASSATTGFGANINQVSENQQATSQIDRSKSHISSYQHMDGTKPAGQQSSEHLQYAGSSYGQYVGGPGYYGFGQQTPSSMVQFSNPYYGDNQYERPVHVQEQGPQNNPQNNPEKPLQQSVGRSQTQQPSTTLPHKKDPVQVNSSEPKEVKRDSKPSPVGVREDTQNVTSPGSASGSRSGNNSARSTPAGANQTASTSESLVNYTAPVSSVASSTTPSNFTPYAAGTSAPTTSLPTHQNPYESMMLNSYSPATCQYNLPGSNTPGAANPFSPAAANYGSPLRPTGAANTVSPYGTPSAYGSSMGYSASAANQYDSDYARASMYSAFHRPEPHHFAPGPTDIGAPFLASMAPPTNPSPFGLPPHHRSPHFPSSPSPSAQNSNYYPQNMYAPSPYAARPGYATTDPTYGVAYGTPGTAGFNPFLNHHLHQHPYPTLQHPGPATPSGAQGSSTSPSQ